MPVRTSTVSTTLLLYSLLILLLLLLGIHLLTSPVQASEFRCDCSCEKYKQVLQSLGSGACEPIKFIDQCGGQCAITWVACEAENSSTSQADHSDDDQPSLPNERLAKQ